MRIVLARELEEIGLQVNQEAETKRDQLRGIVKEIELQKRILGQEEGGQ